MDPGVPAFPVVTAGLVHAGFALGRESRHQRSRCHGFFLRRPPLSHRLRPTFSPAVLIRDGVFRLRFCPRRREPSAAVKWFPSGWTALCPRACSA